MKGGVVREEGVVFCEFRYLRMIWVECIGGINDRWYMGGKVEVLSKGLGVMVGRVDKDRVFVRGFLLEIKKVCVRGLVI